jgi:WD40 repeat protein
LATSAHDKAVPVHGIAVNPSSDRSHLLATFSRVPAEPVKLWDERMMTSCVAEIKIFSSKYSGARVASHDLPSVSSVAWDPCENGMLGIASGDTIRYYDTRTNQSRPALNRMTNSQNAIQSIAFQPPSAKDPSRVASSLTKRMLVAEVDGSIRDLALRQDSAVAISSRDGRITTSVGSVVWVGETTEGRL